MDKIILFFSFRPFLSKHFVCNTKKTGQNDTLGFYLSCLNIQFRDKLTFFVEKQDKLTPYLFQFVLF